MGFKPKSITAILTIICFVSALMIFSSCGGSRNGYSKKKVHSGSGMGDKRQKNKHVWGK